MPASSQTAAHLRQAPRDVAVRSWPVAEGHPAAWGTLLIAGLVCFAAGAMTGSALTGATLAFLLLMAQWRLFLPIRFEIGAGGIQRSLLGRTRRIAWSAVGRAERRQHGLLVQRDYDPSPLAKLHGLFIPYGSLKNDLLTVFDFYLAGRMED